jgi:hypothetical protein
VACIQLSQPSLLACSATPCTLLSPISASSMHHDCLMMQL